MYLFYKVAFIQTFAFCCVMSDSCNIKWILTSQCLFRNLYVHFPSYSLKKLYYDLCFIIFFVQLCHYWGNFSLPKKWLNRTNYITIGFEVTLRILALTAMQSLMLKSDVYINIERVFHKNYKTENSKGFQGIVTQMISNEDNVKISIFRTFKPIQNHQKINTCSPL